MKADLYVKTVLTVIAILLAVIASMPLTEPQSAQAATPGDQAFIHFDPDVTKIAFPDGSADVIGRIAIDLRNGHIYGFPTDELGYPRRPAEGRPATSNPVYLGRFDLDGLSRSR